jgi:diaminohydroxyphosphoribosylaminopyrimidine deaminase/5-amino-6-(5-phosphoribosylamino)uracil reductase
VLEAACREQHRGFLSMVERGRPFVTLKLAATLDGRIATARGESRWITGERARRHVHALRARSDAILVGWGTARADDPALTARRGGRVVHRPVRVILDRALALPASARVFREPGRTWILCGEGVSAARRRAVAARGARLLPIRVARGKLPLARALGALAREGIGSLLVEGGGALAASLLREGLVDELLWYAAPRLLGADARPAVGDLEVRRLAAAPTFALYGVRRFGDDVLIEARLDASRAASRRRATRIRT